MTDALSAAIESILRADDLSEEIHQAQINTLRDAYDAASAQPVQEPVQEPVALDWLHKWANQDDGEPETQWHEGYEAARRVVQIHLTAPPQRKPLALDEIFKLLDRHPRGLFTMGVDEIWMIAFKCCEKEHGIT
jgi:hypothetical protein